MLSTLNDTPSCDLHRQLLEASKGNYGGDGGDGVTEVTGVIGVMGVMGVTELMRVTGVVRSTWGMYPPLDWDCLIRQDSENIAHC